MKITRALISVSNKQGAVDFARELAAFGVELLSTGGTAKMLRDAGLTVTDVSDYTGFPEMLDGRVKTLHPRVHGGILGIRGDAAHETAMQAHDIPPIDLVAVNLYPFAQTVARADCSLADAIENIDIGGPAMLRAAAKNHGGDAGGCTVIADPEDYARVIDAMRSNDGGVDAALRFDLAKKAFVHTARYDSAIANWLTSLDAQQHPGVFPDRLQLSFDKVDVLRYGENPHQQAAFYRECEAGAGAIAAFRQLQGKELSYNNIADADAAWEAVKAFATPACVIVKHANPCGAALAADAEAAYRRAFSTDPTSAFGGIIAFNCELDEKAAQAVSGQFAEVIIAPQISTAARAVFAAKQNLRVLLMTPPAAADNGRRLDFKRIGGGLLVQDADIADVSAGELKVVSRRQPDEREMRDLLFAWRVAKHVKSNAIVYCRDEMTVGVGAGQMSRVDSARIAAIKAENNKMTVSGSVVASDAFFPFRDGLDVLAAAGATAVIQPGGSVRDAEVIAAADEHNVSMVFTGRRHFRH